MCGCEAPACGGVGLEGGRLCYLMPVDWIAFARKATAPFSGRTKVSDLGQLLKEFIIRFVYIDIIALQGSPVTRRHPKKHEFGIRQNNKVMTNL